VYEEAQGFLPPKNEMISQDGPRRVLLRRGAEAAHLQPIIEAVRVALHGVRVLVQAGHRWVAVQVEIGSKR